MLLEPLAFAATAAALMIAPVIPDADAITALPIETIETESFGLAESTLERTVRVPCAQCKGVDSQLELKFAVKDGSRLALNDFVFYPPDKLRMGQLAATLVDGDRREDGKNLGYEMAIRPVTVDEYGQLELIDVDLEIMQVDEQWVEGLPLVKTQIIKTVTGDIFIGDVKLQESSDAECSSFLCRAKAMAEDMLSALGAVKGCVMGQGRHGHHGAEAQTGEPATHAVGVAPAHAEDGEERRHNWRLLLANIASHIFLPVLMGVTAGVGVAVLAMVLCSVVIRLTRFVKDRRARRTQRAGGCCRKKHGSRRQRDSTEKIGLMEALDSDELPPQYQDDNDASPN